MNKALQFFLVLTSLCSWSACTSSGTGELENDRLLAKAYNRSLYWSELAEMLPSETSREDSARIVNVYIERWVRESLLMHEAEKNIPQDLDIDELVRDYRASLIRHNYEKLLVELQLDSVVTPAQVLEYYDTNKEQYRLEQPILRCYYVQVPKEADGWNELRSWWNSQDEEGYKKMVDYCSRNAAFYMLNDSVWYDLDKIVNQLPKNTLSEYNYSSKREISAGDSDFNYLVRIYETKPAGEYAPLEYIREQANKVILHKRKLKLLEDKKEEMYERESRRNNVKIYTN